MKDESIVVSKETSITSQEHAKKALLSFVFGIVGISTFIIVFSILAFVYGKLTAQTHWQGRIGRLFGQIGIIVISVLAFLSILAFIILCIVYAEEVTNIIGGWFGI